MGGLFKKPKIVMPAPQEIAPETVAAQERQEQRIEAQETREQARLAASRRARRRGGQRMLLSMEREDARLGIPSELETYKGA
jgi:hypothetical protein